MTSRLMLAGRIACVLALLAIVCVVTVFFFPALEGPYSVVHGPVTALHSARAATALRLFLLEAGLIIVKSLSGSMMALALFLWVVAIAGSEPERLTCSDSSLLRC